MGIHDNEERFHELSRAGSRLRYWLHGVPGAPLVACTHGGIADHRVFDPQVSALLAAGYRVLAWEYQHHPTDRPLGPRLTLGEVAADLLAVLDDVGAGQAVLVGLSFGGMVGQQFLTDHPERVAALVVVGAPRLSDRPGPVMRVLQRLRMSVLKAWPERHLREKLLPMMSKDPQVRRYIAEVAGRMPKAVFVAQSQAAIDAYVSPLDVSSHGVPLLLVQGEREEKGVARSLRTWAVQDPNARHEVIPDAGHVVNLEDPEAFNRLLVDFLHTQVPAE